MNPLFINTMPSSSQQYDIEKCHEIDSAQYEIVQVSEIVFPNIKNLKLLGRGSYGIVVECYFRGKIAATKILENNKIIHFHNEVITLKSFSNYFMLLGKNIT